MKNISLTIDIETDWGGRLPPKKEYMKGIYEGLNIILALLSKLQIKATFFISTEVISESKSLLINIKKYGHEIASHGHNHKNFKKISKKDFKYQVNKSIDILQETFNESVIGWKTITCFGKCLLETYQRSTAQYTDI